MSLNIFEIELSKRHLYDFTIYTKQNFVKNWFHEKYYQKLDDFSKGKIKRLMAFMPPQHGKSEGSTRRLPAKMIGDNPNLKIGIASYGATKARKFGREIKRILISDQYRHIYPNVGLASGKSEGYQNAANEFEIVGYEGSIKLDGYTGAWTGDPIDIFILDDLYKNRQEALSEATNGSVIDFYNSVAETRLHNDSQVLIVFTRWAPTDLAGYLLEHEPEQWDIVVYPALKEGKPTADDPREDGEPLLPFKHNKEKLLRIQKRDPIVFGSLYQQNPQPKEGLMYSSFKTYKEIPASKTRVRKSYTDTADTGDDYLCSIVYIETELGMYVVDVYYTQDSMETTEPTTAKMFVKHNLNVAKIESNNGGRSFARAVERELRLLKNTKTVITWFHQSLNKDVRIFTKSAEVTNMIYMPEGWERLWPSFYKHVTGYLAQGKNAHDDAPDTLTGMVEDFGNGAVPLEDIRGMFL